MERIIIKNNRRIERGNKIQRKDADVFASLLFSNTAELEMFGQLRVLSGRWYHRVGVVDGRTPSCVGREARCGSHVWNVFGVQLPPPLSTEKYFPALVRPGVGSGKSQKCLSLPSFFLY